MEKNIKNKVAVLIVSILIVSCGGQETSQIGQTEEGTKDLASSAEGIQENNQHLKELTPLSTEQFKSFFPASLIGLPQISFVESFIPGIGSGSATYRAGNRSVRIMIIDGAGEKGSDAVGTYRMSQTMDYDEKGSWGYTKSIFHEEIKMKESGLEDGHFVWALFYKDRFAVDIEGKEIQKEELSTIMQELNLARLPID